MSEPHAYVVEALWNQGGNAYWNRAMEMDDVREPLSLDGAYALVNEMVADGHGQDAVRVAALTVVKELA